MRLVLRVTTWEAIDDTSHQNDRDREATESEGISVLQGATFTGVQTSLVDVGSVGAPEVFDLETPRTSCCVNRGMSGRGGRMIDLETQACNGVSTTNEILT